MSLQELIPRAVKLPLGIVFLLIGLICAQIGFVMQRYLDIINDERQSKDLERLPFLNRWRILSIVSAVAGLGLKSVAVLLVYFSVVAAIAQNQAIFYQVFAYWILADPITVHEIGYMILNLIASLCLIFGGPIGEPRFEKAAYLVVADNISNHPIEFALVTGAVVCVGVVSLIYAYKRTKDIERNTPSMYHFDYQERPWSLYQLAAVFAISSGLCIFQNCLVVVLKSYVSFKDFDAWILLPLIPGILFFIMRAVAHDIAMNYQEDKCAIVASFLMISLMNAALVDVLWNANRQSDALYYTGVGLNILCVIVVFWVEDYLHMQEISKRREVGNAETIRA